MSALTNQVNDMEYIFTENNTIYAVPIECIALERRGTDPYGQADSQLDFHPVINLSSNVVASRTGTSSNPYLI